LEIFYGRQFDGDVLTVQISGICRQFIHIKGINAGNKKPENFKPVKRPPMYLPLQLLFY